MYLCNYMFFIGCGPPPALSGRKIHGNMFSTGHKVLYECETGFVAVGNLYLSVLQTGPGV